MSTVKFPFVVEILLAISLFKVECSYTNEEIEIIKSLGNLLGTKCFAFVQNHQNAELIRVFSKSTFYSVVINADHFDAILNDNLQKKRFFEKNIILITKENLNFTGVLKKLSDVRSLSWIVFAESLNEFDNFYIPVNTNFFIVRNTLEKNIINKAYNIKQGLDVSIKEIGTWSKGSSEQKLVLKREKRINFERAKLKMLYLSREKECNKRAKNHVLDRMECFQQELWKIIAEKLNFTIVRTECPERCNPYNYPNGSLSEMFLILERGNTDISSGSYIINNDRLNRYDFAWPVFTTKSMMYLKYKSTKSNWRAFLRPMHSDLWAAIATWIILTGILVQIFKEFDSRNFTFRFSLIEELIQSMLLTLQIFCNQGIHNMSDYQSSRMVFMATFLLFIALYEAYSGFLISFLTISVPDVPFTDLNEFFDDGTYRIMTLRKGFHKFYMKKIFSELKQEDKNLIMKEEELPVNPIHGIKKLCGMMKLTYVEFRENIVQYEIPCKIMELPKPMLYQSVGFGFPKSSPYKEIVNKEISFFRSTGILHRMKKFLFSYVSLQERETSENTYISVSFTHVKSIFFVFGIGITISIILFLLEVLWKGAHKRKIVEKKHFRYI